MTWFNKRNPPEDSVHIEEQLESVKKHYAINQREANQADEIKTLKRVIDYKVSQENETELRLIKEKNILDLQVQIVKLQQILEAERNALRVQKRENKRIKERLPEDLNEFLKDCILNKNKTKKKVI